MLYIGICIAVMVAAYVVNITFLSVFYHRGLTHGAITLSPRLRKFVVFSGNWITGIDPKGWVCLHRLHHEYSDTAKDPHSPAIYGIVGTMLAQLRGFNVALRGLIKKQEPYTSVVKDLEFDVSWLNRNRMWYVPYVVHALIALVIGWGFGLWLLGAAYWLGIMSHPLQGWMVNAFGHSKGYRNYQLKDASTNNSIVAWIVMGEGFQNNHHQSPSSAKFSHKWFEVDMGYGICRLFNTLGLITINSIAIEPMPDHLQTQVEHLQPATVGS